MKKVTLSRTSLYIQVAEHLRKEIASMAEGSRIESENELVQRFGVSILTVREALKVLSNEGLIERQQGRGTFVREKTAVSKQHVAVVIDQDISHPMSSPIYFRIAQYTRRMLSEVGIQAQLYIGLNKPSEGKRSINCPEFVDALKREKISGIVAVLAYPDPFWVDEVNRQNIPIVRNGWQGDEIGVSYDYASFIRRAVQRLAEGGRRKIALIGSRGSSSGSGNTVSHYFEEAMSQTGLSVNPEWVQCEFQSTTRGAGWSAFREIWTARRERPEGLIVSDDFLFSSLVPAIMEMGISFPDDLEVHTLVNKESLPYAAFPFVSYQVCPHHVASRLCSQLLTLMEGKRPENVLLKLEEVDVAHENIAAVFNNP